MPTAGTAGRSSPSRADARAGRRKCRESSWSDDALRIETPKRETSNRSQSAAAVIDSVVKSHRSTWSKLAACKTVARRRITPDDRGAQVGVWLGVPGDPLITKSLWLKPHWHSVWFPPPTCVNQDGLGFDSGSGSPPPGTPCHATIKKSYSVSSNFQGPPPCVTHR